MDDARKKIEMKNGRVRAESEKIQVIDRVHR